jgi:uncharacterized protein (DUF849 family)
MNVILGNIYNSQSDISSVSSIINNLPENTKVCIGGIGKDQLKSNLLGLLYADGIRIGLEDNLYFTDKVKTTNIKLLWRIKTMIDELEMSVMSPLEFKELGYGNKSRS